MTNHHARLRGMAGIAAAGMLILGACAAPEDSAGAPEAAATAEAGSAAEAEVSAAQEVVTPLLETPSTINQTEPITGDTSSDKPFVVITCELPQCQLISDGTLEAAEAMGWETELLAYKTTDGATLTSAMKEALTYDPFAVAPIGFSQTLWQPLVQDFEDAGVIITPVAVGDTEPGGPVTQGSASQLDYAASGKAMAAWVTADSAADATILLQDVPAFAVLAAYGDGFREGIAEYCSGCTITELENAPAQLASNGIVPSVVSELQKKPDIDYVVSTDTAFLAAGLPSALEAAGISGVKVVGGSPDINSLQGVVSGDIAAVSATAEDQYGWTAVDIVARTMTGMDVPEADGGRVQMIAVQDNVGTPSPAGLGFPEDYREQYKALWGK
ncbi:MULTISPECIES: substrate-binding domain-containing protein [unclassified Nocardioides]|uniref:sugar ABC transporter substrate-binding protein n=1 Tax=unclassified Nocardioides TaxID=2615069 RepID=UPI000702DF98|nr:MULTISPECIES: substrate-binding domain-containing protein [unclassified Nocardioides]KQP65283.1 hypothetical protein ASF47_05520 [Nocardioides sp. Leaf285]KQQ42549.1 hypothetical protein ASF50_00255 [Nocardioides sp. Leaf307]MCM3516655.1 substrate-binding domain-containing protein [Nocardioides sp. P86]